MCATAQYWRLSVRYCTVLETVCALLHRTGDRLCVLLHGTGDCLCALLHGTGDCLCALLHGTETVSVRYSTALETLYM